MSALPPSQTREMRETAHRSREPIGSIARRWKDLHDTAARIAAMARLAPEHYAPELAAFPAMLGEATEWQRELAWQGIDDIDAMMHPGLAALDTLVQRGKDPSAPALALWREFHHARETVLNIVQPHAV